MVVKNIKEIFPSKKFFKNEQFSQKNPDYHRFFTQFCLYNPKKGTFLSI